MKPAAITSLEQLADYVYPPGVSIPAGADHWLFYVGRDNVHEVLVALLSWVSVSLHLNMFGYDDDELNRLVMAVVDNPAVTTQITLDRSQAGGVHERALLASDAAGDSVGYRNSFVVGTSSTHQISHTKGGVIDGRIAFEGSTNWSTSGEGTFVVGSSEPGGPGFKAQNNTLLVCSDPATIARFTAELVAEHTAAKAAAHAANA